MLLINSAVVINRLCTGDKDTTTIFETTSILDFSGFDPSTSEFELQSFSTTS